MKNISSSFKKVKDYLAYYGLDFEDVIEVDNTKKEWTFKHAFNDPNLPSMDLYIMNAYNLDESKDYSQIEDLICELKDEISKLTGCEQGW